MPPSRGETGIAASQRLPDGDPVHDHQSLDALRMVKREPRGHVEASVVAGDREVVCPSAAMRTTRSRASARFDI